MRLAGPADIGAMKMVAILGRAAKKGYIDIYFLMKRLFRAEELLEFYDRKFGNLESNRLALMKGLQYFEDAEDSEMPVMLEEVNWEEVMSFLRSETKKLWKRG